MSADTPHPHDTAFGGARAGPSVGSTARALSIVGFVLAALAIVVFPIVLGPIGAVLGFVAHRKGDPLGRWAAIAAVVCTILGMVLGYLVFTAAT